MKTCPQCGFEGEDGHCPNDGERLLDAEELADVSPIEPTRAPPSEATQRKHAAAPGPGEAHDPDAELRGEDYGNWAEPALPKKKKEDPMIGRTLGGRYEIIGLLGKGGMGAVYKARQPAVQRMIALKTLLKEFTENETVIKRFHQEALAASRLTHPNTISVYDFGQTDDGILFMAMEYLRGQSLAQLLARNAGIDPKRVIHIMRQVCKSLSEAHGAGIIHRDLKPDNIFLTDIQGERDFVKVLDFGVAKLKEYEGKEGTLTQAGMIFGTPKYMSPEQARSGELDARSDVYALGVILYEMLMGRPPFVGDNPLSILIAHVNEHPPALQTIRADHGVPAPLEAVVFKALAKDRALRHATVDELLEELDAVDAILDGATYDSVASRLPSLPGADGAPSLAGPAIMPQGRAGTSPGDIRPSGNTEVLAENAIEGTEPTLAGGMVFGDEPAPDALRPPKSKVPVVVASVGVPVLIVGAVMAFAFGGGPAADDEKKDAGGSTVAANRPVDAAPPPADAGAAADAASKVDAAPQTYEFVVSSDPAKALLYEAKSGKRIGTTVQIVKITAPTEYTLSLSGYEDRTFTLSPGDDKNQSYVLKAKAEPARPRPPRKPPTKDPEPVATGKDPTPQPTGPGLRPRPAGPGNDNVPIDLQ